VLAARPPEDVVTALCIELHRIDRTGVVHRRGDYAPGLTSVAATFDKRAALGIMWPDKASPVKYQPLVAAAAVSVRHAQGF
jgi:hypothetical protein